MNLVNLELGEVLCVGYYISNFDIVLIRFFEVYFSKNWS